MADKAVVVEETEVIEEIETTTTDPAYQLDPGMHFVCTLSCPRSLQVGLAMASAMP